jgi:hypothetical protein
MTWSINGSTPSEASYINGKIFTTGKKINDVQLNICYFYDLTNNNPPFPPQPPVDFSYTDCFGNPQNVNVNSGPPTTICALVGTVVDPPGGSSSQGSRCTS